MLGFMRAPIHPTDEVQKPEAVPRMRLEKRGKRGPKKKILSAEEQTLRAMTPRMRDLAEGRLKVEDLDWEELTRGRLRDKDGGFRGKAPIALPREWHDAIAAEIVRGAQSQFRKNFDATMQVLVRMALDPKTPAREKLAASQYIIERVIGKIPEKQEIKSEISIFDSAIANGEFLVDLGEEETPSAIESGDLLVDES